MTEPSTAADPAAAATGFRPRAVALAAGAGLGMLAAAEVSAAGARWFGFEGPRCPLDGPLCPGCGLTRSAGLAVHGELSTAFAVHPVGPLVALLLVGALLVAGHAWWRGTVSSVHLRLARLGRLALLIGLGLVWSSRLS